MKVTQRLSGICCRTSGHGQILKLTCHQSKVFQCEGVIRRDSQYKTPQIHDVVPVGVGVWPVLTSSNHRKIVAAEARLDLTASPNKHNPDSLSERVFSKVSCEGAVFNFVLKCTLLIESRVS